MIVAPGRAPTRSRGDAHAERRSWPGSRPPAPRVARAARKDWISPLATTGTDYATAGLFDAAGTALKRECGRTRKADRAHPEAPTARPAYCIRFFVRLVAAPAVFAATLTAEVFRLDRGGLARGTAGRNGRTSSSPTCCTSQRSRVVELLAGQYAGCAGLGRGDWLSSIDNVTRRSSAVSTRVRGSPNTGWWIEFEVIRVTAAHGDRFARPVESSAPGGRRADPALPRPRHPLAQVFGD